MSVLQQTVGRSIRLYSMMASYNVLHKKGRFYIELEKGRAVLEYELHDGIIDMYHTGVPTAYRGQGIAKVLVEDALKYAETEKLKVRPSCSYVLKYVTEHPNPSIQIDTL